MGIRTRISALMDAGAGPFTCIWLRMLRSETASRETTMGMVFHSRLRTTSVWRIASPMATPGMGSTRARAAISQ